MNYTHNEILDELLLRQADKKDAYPFLLIVIPTIKNVSSKIIDNIYLNALRFELSGINEDRKEVRQVRMHRSNVFGYLAGISRRSELYKSFIKAFDFLYNEIKEDPEKVLLYFVMYDELMLDKLDRSDSAGVNYGCVADTLQQSNAYKELLEKDSYLCLLDIYCNYYVLKKPEINNLLNAVKLFGIRSFFKSYESKFSRYNLSYWSYFINFYFKEENIDKSDEILLQIEKAGISRIQLFKQLRSRKLMQLGFYIEQTPKLLKQLSNTNELTTKMFMIALIYQILSNSDTYYPGRDRKLHMVNLVKAHELKWLEDLLQVTDKKEAFGMIEAQLKND